MSDKQIERARGWNLCIQRNSTAFNWKTRLPHWRDPEVLRHLKVFFRRILQSPVKIRGNSQVAGVVNRLPPLPLHSQRRTFPAWQLSSQCGAVKILRHRFRKCGGRMSWKWLKIMTCYHTRIGRDRNVSSYLVFHTVSLRHRKSYT